MTWRTISNSEDLKAFEKKAKDGRVRIEARLGDKGWEVYKTYVHDGHSYLTGRYHVKESDLNRTILRLKREKLLSPQEAKTVQQESSVDFRFERAYKEDFIEKWVFKSKSTHNFLVVRYDENITVDVVLDDRYKPLEGEVLEQIRKTLGFEDLGEVKFTLYYYHHRSERRDESKRSYGVVVGRFELDFEDD
ncbi:MAG: hypothetical protein ABIA93_04450 [Candidatus Woesearchaeota archaeon]